MSWEKIAANVSKEIYHDGLQPAVLEVGQVLGSIAKTARFALFPFEIGALYQDRFQAWLKRLSDKIPREKMISPHPSLTGPILESIKWTDEDSLLEDMFLNLLAGAMDKERVSEAHPAFVNIIKQISPDEALLLSEINKNGPYSLDIEKVTDYVDLSTSQNYIFPKALTKQLVFPNNIKMYTDHLTHLNLTGYGIREVRLPENTRLHTDYRQIEFSEFGSMFARACITDKSDSMKIEEI